MQTREYPANLASELVLGTVSSINPITIMVGELRLTESFLVLSPFCIETRMKMRHRHSVAAKDSSSALSEVNLEHTHSTAEGTTGPSLAPYNFAHTHNISSSYTGYYEDTAFLWRGLRAGDVVWMLKCNGGQKYYVLQREGGLV